MVWQLVATSVLRADLDWKMKWVPWYQSEGLNQSDVGHSLDFQGWKARHAMAEDQTGHRPCGLLHLHPQLPQHRPVVSPGKPDNHLCKRGEREELISSVAGQCSAGCSVIPATGLLPVSVQHRATDSANSRGLHTLCCHQPCRGAVAPFRPSGCSSIVTGLVGCGNHCLCHPPVCSAVP